MDCNSEQRRNRPEFSLEAIRRLASQKKIVYASDRVIRDVKNLDYSLDDVCECLSLLQKDHYRNSVMYSGKGGWLDEYLITFQGPGGYSDPLYIKLKLNRNCITIVLCSFHREGSL